MRISQKYDLQERLVKFSASIITNINGLNKDFASEHLAKQLIRSSTSSALNYGEAQAAESRRDFIHKMKICLKELRESQVNLQVLKEARLINDLDEFNKIIQECKELVAIFTSSVKTTATK
ncbi:four helix bundle protein [Aquimarina sp. 2201CG5-10]|uniref:four helix bundle protein n=1 Tax=Aquimarina callyspongiae TaxID=3098150 RepID=UPI002AB5ADAC|nr:four helix bundle protein [Aquimarina sp. 2201CG5-10]MDY8134576.1 four helix bundle protein [Aquimarina sp. 2201CG5-10]